MSIGSIMSMIIMVGYLPGTRNRLILGNNKAMGSYVSRSASICPLHSTHALQSFAYYPHVYHYANINANTIPQALHPN